MLVDWKSFFVKYFDINANKKPDTWEIILIIFLIILFQLSIEIGGNYLYDKMFNKASVTIHYEKNQSDTNIKK